MPAQLVALNDSPSILVDKPILLVGRHPECDITIESRKISRRHCCIAQVEGHILVRDLGSTNGIRINGVRVVEGKLKEDDELTIGNNRFQVRMQPEGGPLPLKPVRPPPLPPPAASAKAKPPARPLPDEILEDYDDPVALDEPDDSPPMLRSKPKPPSSVKKAPRKPLPPPSQGRADPTGVGSPSDVIQPPSSQSHPG
jgi:predicted component of type VI protein secretion system